MFHRAVAAVATVSVRSCLATVCQRPPANHIRIESFSSLRFANRHQRAVLRPQTINISSQRQLHPVVVLVAKQVAKLFAMLTGRGFRKWWKNLPPDKRQYFIEKIRRNKKGIALSTAATLGAGGTYYVMHLQPTPLTNRVRFMAFNEEEIKKLNAFTAEMQYEMVKDKLLHSSHPNVKRVSRVTTRLLEANNDIEEIFSKEWSVSVINSPLENAFVGPSGQIVVFSGMLGICENDDQLGCVLAHEVAHAILNHGAEMMSYTNLVDIFIVFMLTAIWAIMPTDLVAAAMHWCFNRVCALMVELPYSRLLEVEADVVGLDLAAKACFDVRESSAFWTKMSMMKQFEGETPLPEFLSTHPDNAKRSETLDAMMDEAIRKRLDCRCPPLTRTDPRVSLEVLRHQIHAARKWRESIAKEGVLVIPVPRR